MGERDTRPGAARSSGPSVQDLLELERNPVPKALREVSYQYLGSERLPAERYTSREFFERECARLWSRAWQFACREEEIPRVGDYVVYEVADLSLLVVRTAPDVIKALFNVCLHRGRLLRTRPGNASEFRCPFHGWTWNLDGSLERVPCRWDFSRLRDEAYALPEARVGTWGGFVFVNPDPDAVPLEEFLAPVPEHFRRWALEDRYMAAYVGREVNANWKVVMEAFIESYHVLGTHPQILATTGDANTQYDVWPDRPHVNRMITPFGVPSPHLAEVSEQKVADAFMAVEGAPPGSVRVPLGVSARDFLGDLARGMLERQTGRDFSHVTNCELLDAIQYFVFPNFFPWAGYLQSIVYRFRPLGDDPDRALMECILLRPVPEGAERPPPAPLRMIGPGEEWTDAPELGGLGPVFQQDWSNIEFVQRGLRAMRGPGVSLGDYQEIRIRHFHRTLDRYLERD